MAHCAISLGLGVCDFFLPQQREKLDLLCINLVSMPYVGVNEYNLIEFRQNSFMAKDEKDTC